jgi:hypothetical protein
MWKYLAALLVVLFSLGGLVAAQAPATTDCADCYANIVTQSDAQTIQTVTLAAGAGMASVGNEGLSAGIIVTQAPVINPTVSGDEDQFFVPAPFARIDQVMNQKITNLGSLDYDDGNGAKGITWNKAIQAAWIANQGVKEYKGELDPEDAEYAKEGTYINQNTTQLTNNVYDYDSREGSKILNVDNKLAMIVDNMTAILDLSANADSSTTDTQSASGTIDDFVNLGINGNQDTTST